MRLCIVGNNVFYPISESLFLFIGTKDDIYRLTEDEICERINLAISEKLQGSVK